MRARAVAKSSIDDLHGVGAGVDEARLIEHRAHVALPEDQVAALQRRIERDRGSPSAFSIRSVSRGAGMPAASSAVWIRPEQSIPA